ncbi:hypothetical protein HQN89_35780 [Paenibacillus frigoriresistens]|uniref:hypothetical protein n=1 Tax=Paenibacillus alginolyticus TaxID=59839 RepID=UPI0015675BB9|nr:hypothetical protein [Paenibacillus frigoriresistens]NRF96156.1 hypothetical protein [Paenibacillus frigoriresistens]
MGSTVREDIIEYTQVGRASKYTAIRFRRKHFKKVFGVFPPPASQKKITFG